VCFEKALTKNKKQLILTRRILRAYRRQEFFDKIKQGQDFGTYGFIFGKDHAKGVLFKHPGNYFIVVQAGVGI
jgi:hypothetical protein